MKNINYNKTEFLIEEVIYYHKILYKRYLDRLNALLVKNNYNFNVEKEEIVNNLEIFPIEDRGNILFNLGGVINHELYFDNIEPSKNILNNEILNKIEMEYDSILEFKNIFKTTALKLVGSGYTFLVLDKNNKLKIINMTNQETPLSIGYIPLIALDLWEHAYYLQYNVNKEEYIDKFLNNLNFNNINRVYLDNIDE